MKLAPSLKQTSIKPPSVSQWLNLFVVGLLAGILSLLYIYADSLKILLQTRAQGTAVECPIQQKLSCQVNTELGELTLSTDRVIQSLETFHLTLKTQQVNWQKAEIRFEGVDDYMGINRFKFSPSKSIDSQWHTKGSIPICTTDAKNWRVIINLTSQSKVSRYWFIINTQ